MVGGGPDEGDAGGANGCLILRANGLRGAASLFDIAAEAALEADVVWGFDVDAELVKRQEIGIEEREKAFDEEKWRWVDELGDVRDSRVGREVVGGALDGAAL